MFSPSVLTPGAHSFLIRESSADQTACLIATAHVIVFSHQRSINIIEIRLSEI